jgi:hypothetical protein
MMIAQERVLEALMFHQPARIIEIGAHIDMKAADGSLVVGWLASQTDLLAEDWVEVE